jgi:esterase/lipase
MKKNKYIFSIIFLIVLIVGYSILDNFLFDGIKPKKIKNNDFQAEFFSKENWRKKTTVILIGGGQWGHYWGSELTKNGYVALSIPYYREKGLPRLMEEIPLEYFENAFKFLKDRPEVNPDKIIVMGASRNAELALLLASKFPKDIHGVIAYSPSSVVWSNTVMPFNSNSIKPSWTFNTKDIAFIPMAKLSEFNFDTLTTLDYWEKGLNNSTDFQEAIIKVEKINGPILLFSGKRDKVWPSSKMADSIEKRLIENNFEYAVHNIQYNNAGHLISGNPEDSGESRSSEFTIENNVYTYEYGGTKEGDNTAKINAKQLVFKFLKNINLN